MSKDHPIKFCFRRRLQLCGIGVLIVLALGSQAARGAIFAVDVAANGLSFTPATVSIQAGDTVTWTWRANGHSVTSGTPGSADGLFDSGVRNSGFTFSQTFLDPGTFGYFCMPHGLCCSMIGSVKVAAATPTPAPSPSPDPNVPAQPVNISTRLQVLTDAKVLIGGFIIDGTQPKRILLRAIGPSLTQFGVTDALADPVLELHASDQTLITTNDNWKIPAQGDIEATQLQPTDDLESAIVTTLAPGSYTAVVTGKDGATGVGLVEGYDLDPGADSRLSNISTRGFVDTGDNVMIGGFILGNGGGSTTVLIRAIGPSLTPFGVVDALPDPTLELHDINGATLRSNDNWKDTQQGDIEGTMLQPNDKFESAILATLAPGSYTAVVKGQGGVTGVALVEVYRLP